MPYYRFKCTDCEREFKELILSKDMSDTFCPDCGSSNIKKLPSKFGVTYKSDGFHSTKDRKEEE